MRLSKYLTRHKITMRQFGERIGKSASQVCRIASGERFPDPAAIEEIERTTKGQVMAEDHMETWREYRDGRAARKAAP